MQSEDSNDSNRKQGRWTALEHQIYKDFFQTNPQVKKGNRIFKKLSDLIGTRTPSQCRSHHQKFKQSTQIRLRSKQYIRYIFSKNKEKDSETES